MRALLRPVFAKPRSPAQPNESVRRVLFDRTQWKALWWPRYERAKGILSLQWGRNWNRRGGLRGVLVLEEGYVRVHCLSHQPAQPPAPLRPLWHDPLETRGPMPMCRLSARLRTLRGVRRQSVQRRARDSKTRLCQPGLLSPSGEEVVDDGGGADTGVHVTGCPPDRTWLASSRH